MGNYISCTLSKQTGSKHSRLATKVIFPSGEIQKIMEPLKAAELMLESPNSFVVNSKSLQMGRRFLALNADEDLEMGNVYIMFPMKRVNSAVKASDMAMLFMAPNSAAKHVSLIGDARISPESSTSAVAQSRGEDVEEFMLPEFKYRLSMCRSKKPLLETIVEEPICSI